MFLEHRDLSLAAPAREYLRHRSRDRRYRAAPSTNAHGHFCAQPFGKIAFAHFACRKLDHRLVDRKIIRFELISTVEQERLSGDQGDALVAVNERMIAHDSVRIS